MPVKLKVSYADKEVVKSMGAWWNAKQKYWYISDWQSKKEFAKWIPMDYDVENLAEKMALEYFDSVQKCPVVDSLVFGSCFDVTNLKTDYWNCAYA